MEDNLLFGERRVKNSLALLGGGADPRSPLLGPPLVCRSPVDASSKCSRDEALGLGKPCVSHSRKERAADVGPMSAFERDRKMRRESRCSQTNLKK